MSMSLGLRIPRLGQGRLGYELQRRHRRFCRQNWQHAAVSAQCFRRSVADHEHAAGLELDSGRRGQRHVPLPVRQSSRCMDDNTALTWTPGALLSEGTHRLYVQERDPEGNWSASGFFDIVIDLTGPNPPTVSGASPTNDTTPMWTWTTGGGGGNGTFRYLGRHGGRLGGNALRFVYARVAVERSRPYFGTSRNATRLAIGQCGVRLRSRST